MADFPRVNEVYGRVIGDARPARSTVQVAGLPRGVLVEIDAVAQCRDRSSLRRHDHGPSVSTCHTLAQRLFRLTQFARCAGLSLQDGSG